MNTNDTNLPQSVASFVCIRVHSRLICRDDRISPMTGLPERNEAAPYYYTYIDLVTDPDVVGVLDNQVEPTSAFLRGISEEKSLDRYAPETWSIRQAWNHVNDAERRFVSRALWVADGFDGAFH